MRVQGDPRGGSLLGGLFAAQTKTLFERSELARRDIGLDTFTPSHATATGRKIFLHLAIPFIFLEIVKSLRQFAAFRLREMDD